MEINSLFLYLSAQVFSASRFNEEVQVTGRRRTSVLFISITKLGVENSNVFGMHISSRGGFSLNFPLLRFKAKTEKKHQLSTLLIVFINRSLSLRFHRPTAKDNLNLSSLSLKSSAFSRRIPTCFSHRLMVE